MAYFVRLMGKQDIPQVNEIDREAFPTQLPAANYYDELQNRRAHYVVACQGERAIKEPRVKATPQETRFSLVSWVKQVFCRNHSFSDELPQLSGEYILGFAGFRLMADEAHIISIAVREHYRRRGIGELLLISIIDLATELNASSITLEVRVSNTVARYLYRKYGFTQVGMHSSYYTDNREDAILMSSERLTSASFQARLNQLKQAHSRKCRIAAYEIAR